MDEEKKKVEENPIENYNENTSWVSILKRVIISTLGKDDIRNDVILTAIVFFLFLFLKEGLIEDTSFFNSLKWISSLIVVGTGAKYFKEEAHEYLKNKKK
jgi:hypothetical protein